MPQVNGRFWLERCPDCTSRRYSPLAPAVWLPQRIDHLGSGRWLASAGPEIVLLRLRNLFRQRSVRHAGRGVARVAASQMPALVESAGCRGQQPSTNRAGRRRRTAAPVARAARHPPPATDCRAGRSVAVRP